MKLKNSFFYTIRENVKDEESTSGNLLVRSGMIKKVGSGIYMYMPLGLKLAQNIEKIIREEMNNAGAQELVMPSLIPEEYYVESERRDVFGNDMFGLKDRFNRNYVLGPTHEELFVYAAREKIKSYKDMPFNLYQMANKYRDEPRPRYGLIRVREFVMKDAYSFDATMDSLNESYNKMFNAYKNIFDRIGINYTIVTASTGAMGGLLSEEFQAITDIGEDTLVLCDKCNYAANLEISTCKYDEQVEEELEKELLYTPNVGTIDDLVNGYNMSTDKMVKTLLYRCDDKIYACLIKSNRELSEDKLKLITKAKEVEMADHETVMELTHANVGFAGPIGLEIPIIIDEEVLLMKNFLVGANKTDYHYINVNIKDFKYDIKADIKLVNEGDTCPNCDGHLHFKKGIEVGNTFKLGTKYSEKLGLYYLDENNNQQPVIMGCYGIGIGRIIAALAEQKHDDKGLVWPINVAPYKVDIVLIDSKDENQVNFANELYETLTRKGIDVILDDRDTRPGVKFNDADLIGTPIRITIGKKLAEGKVELKLRNNTESTDINKEEIIDKILEML